MFEQNNFFLAKYFGGLNKITTFAVENITKARRAFSWHNSKIKKIMKYNVMTNSEIKKGAKQESTTVNTNPRYNFRKLNKFADGKDIDAKEVDGYSREYTKELKKRLCEAFGTEGFWWGSVIARQGYLVTSARKVVFAEGSENNEDVKGLNVAKGEMILTEVINGQMYTLKTAAVWSPANIITSACLWLKFAEERAKESGSLYSWQKEQELAKAKAKDAKKEEAKKARKEASKKKKQAKEHEAKEAAKALKQAKDVQALKQAWTNKEITKAEYTKRLLALVG